MSAHESTADDLDMLIHRADLDGLVRRVDELCAARDWAGVLELRDRSKAALATGRQLWPAATLAEYRLALWGPPEWAARVLDESSGRFTIGPLTEVVAQHHSAAELRSLIDDPVRFGFVAHERVLRGEAVDATINPLEIPFEIAAWEPDYTVPTYSDEGIDAPSPTPVKVTAERAQIDALAAVEDPEVDSAVRQLFDVWTANSNGHVELVCVEGSAPAAVGALGVGQARLQPIPLTDAVAWLAWAGASGGAHGRRRGSASGRFGAWWLLASLTDSLDDWPLDPIELGERAAALSWYWWDTGHDATGWTVQLAIEDPESGYAWALAATDAAS